MSGELTKPFHLPTTVLSRARGGDGFAVHAIRALLHTLILGVKARQSRDRSTTTRHEWRRGSSPEIVAVAGVDPWSAQLRGHRGRVTSSGRVAHVVGCSAPHPLEVGNMLRVLFRTPEGLRATQSCGCTWDFSQPSSAPA